MAKIQEFNSDNSYFLAVCINKQTSIFRRGEQNHRILVGCQKVQNAFLDKDLVSAENCRLFAASSSAENCSFVGLKRTFIKAAEKVKDNGIFFFHFSGHGVRPNNDFGIAPTDYDDTHDMCITAATLKEWLKEAKLKATYVVITLDSCYSEGIAEAITRGSDDPSPLHEFQVITSCRVGETSFTIESIGSTIFSHFLSYVIKTTCESGYYPIETIYERCQKLSGALSSLFIERGNFGPFEKTTTIVWKSAPFSGLVDDLNDEPKQGANTNNKSRFSYPIESLCTQGAKKLDRVSHNWLLNSCFEKELPTLVEFGPETWDISLVEAVLHGMMRSTVILQQHYAPDTVATANIYITAFMHVATLMSLKQNIVFDKYYCRKGLEYYIDGLHDISEEKMQPLKELLRKLQ